MASLLDYQFTISDDDAIAINDGSDPSSMGWEIIDGTVKTLSGNDRIYGECGTENDRFGLGLVLNNATLDLGNGNDAIETRANGGIGLTRSQIYGGPGNDRIEGNGDEFGDGISLVGSIINTGAGSDSLRGIGGRGIFMNLSSTIDTSAGNDDIYAEGRTNGENGLWIRGGSRILTGTGSDSITGIQISSIFSVCNGLFVEDGLIDMGEGSDVLTCDGKITDLVVGNNGMIQMGRGSDTVTSINGTISGGGIIDMGEGDDALRGFGDLTANGGRGIDKLILNAGVYQVELTDLGFTVTNGETQMDLQSIEYVSSTLGSTIRMREGILSVGDDGSLVLS
jgi:hypothetical protein